MTKPALLVLMLAACAGGAPQQKLAAGDAVPLGTLAALYARLAAHTAQPQPRAVAVVIGTTATSVRKAAWDGADARSWEHAAQVTQRPVIDGQTAVFGDGADLAALDVASGEPRWRLPARGAQLIAALDVDGGTALLLAQAQPPDRWISLIDDSGRERWRVSAPELGTPAALGGSLILPWGGHFVSAIHARSGEELGRARVETPISHALESAGEIFLGGPPFLAFDGSPNTWEPPRRPLPGSVVYPPEIAAAGDAMLTRVYVRPPLRGDEPQPFMATFGRVAMGFEGASGALSWVHVLPGAALAAAVLGDALALCDASGSARLLEPRSGATIAEVRLGRSRSSRRALPEPALGGCAIGSGATPAAAAPPVPDVSLVQQIALALAPADPDLSEAQRFLSRELAARPEPEATRALIELAMRRSADRTLQAEAEDLLATRRNGADLMLNALAADADPGALPPLGALADALGALEEARAAPLLAAQMNRAGHAPEALERAANALERLGTPAEYDELRVFFSLYRTTADRPELERAVISVGRTLLRVGGRAGRELVAFAVRDPLTVGGVRSALANELETAPPAP